jgi:hypothetical protein
MEIAHVPRNLRRNITWPIGRVNQTLKITKAADDSHDRHFSAFSPATILISVIGASLLLAILAWFVRKKRFFSFRLRRFRCERRHGKNRFV